MSIIIMILLLSLLILVHEAGHFFVARALKIKVDKVGFGLPFGKPIFQKKIGDITYCLHWLLLGGYVGFPDDDPDSTVPKDDPDRFHFPNNEFYVKTPEELFDIADKLLTDKELYSNTIANCDKVFKEQQRKNNLYWIFQ